MAETNGADVELDIAGQKVNFKNIKSLNTGATLATLILVSVLGYAFYVHAGETKDQSKELVSALKEMTQAAREQNCLMRFDQKDRQANADFCKQIAR